MALAGAESKRPRFPGYFAAARVVKINTIACPETAEN
jgi:hypothetical protein